MVLAFRSSRPRVISFAVALAAIFLIAAAVHAQDQSANDSTKRKVKTRVAAEYPSLARHMGVTGKVKVEVTITADGKVSNTRIVGGSPVLAAAAVEAAKKWKFEAGPKDTTEILEFEFKDPSS